MWIVDQKSAYERYLATQNTQDRFNYDEKKKLLHKEIKNVKNKDWEERCQEINLESGNTRANKAWKTIKDMLIQQKDVSLLYLNPGISGN